MPDTYSNPVAKPRATLVFENGLMLDLKTWEDVAQRLNNCCDLLFYNRPGVGRSESEQDQLSPERSAARLQQLLQQQKLAPPYVLIGHSHYPFVYPNKNSLLINVGSVGQSRLIGGIASWALFNTKSNTFQLRSTT